MCVRSNNNKSGAPCISAAPVRTALAEACIHAISPSVFFFTGRRGALLPGCASCILNVQELLNESPTNPGGMHVFEGRRVVCNV